MHPAGTLALMFPLLTASLAAAQTPHPHAESLHKQAVAALKQRLIPAVSGRFVQEVGNPIKEKLELGRDFNLLIGPNLTRGGKALYLAVWGDKLFTFEMTTKQKEMAGLRPGGIQLRDGIPEREVGRTPDVVKLTNVTLDGGTRHKMNQELSGWLTFTPKDKFEGEVIVRVSVLSEGQRVTQFQHIRGGLPVNDRITFRLKPLKTVNGNLLPSPAILFVDLCSTTEASGGTDLTVRSNAQALLIDLVE